LLDLCGANCVAKPSLVIKVFASQVFLVLR
jgi:hypothetical protein